MIPIENLPVKFNLTDINECDTFDQREYCQPVQQSDPLNVIFNLDIGANIIGCNEFINNPDATGDECCYGCGGEGDATPATWQSYGNQLANGDGFLCMSGDEGQEMAMNTPTYPVGNYKMVIVVSPVDHYAEFTYTPTGTFYVNVGDWTSGAISTQPGTYTIYPVVTIAGNIDFVALEDGTQLCLESVNLYPICTDYSLNVTDKDGNFISNHDVVNYEGAQGLVQINWSDLGLDNGCYRLCIINECTIGNEMTTNGALSSDVGWGVPIAPGTWGYDPVNDEMDHSNGNAAPVSNILSIPLVSSTYYVLTYQIKNYVSGNLTAHVGGASGTAGMSRSGNGTYTEVIKTSASVAANLYFTPSSNFVGSLDNVSLRLAEDGSPVCSTCYALDNEHACTKLLSWTNDDDAFGIPYSSIVFTNYLRVVSLLEKPRYPTEVDRFVFSDGRRKILYASSEKIWILAFDYLPEYLHDAIAIGKVHDHFYIDGVEYICSSDEYQPEWRNRLKLAQSKIDVQKIIDNNKNKNC